MRIDDKEEAGQYGLKKLPALLFFNFQNDSFYTLDFLAKVDGYTITDQLLLENDKDDVNKPVLDVYLERGDHRHPVFDMSKYGLHFKDQVGKWVQIR